MKTKIYSLLGACLLIVSSCSLDETPLSQISESEAYKSEKLLYINTVGTVVSGLGTVFKGNTDALCTIQDIAGGQLFNPGRGGGDWQDGGKHQVLFMHTWREDNGYMSSGWNALWGKVAAINKSIGTIEQYKSDYADPTDLDNWIYELRGLRAVFYWYLLDMYGNVPICETSDQTVAETVPSSRIEVYEFVRDELSEVIPHLIDAQCQNASDEYYGRVTKAVGYFIMARLALNAPVYLTTDTKVFATNTSIEEVNSYINESGKNIQFTLDGETRNAWETVIYCQKKCAELGYTLQPNFADNFDVSNDKGNVENIFVIPRDDTSFQVNDQDLQRSLHGNHGAYLGMANCWNGLAGTRATAFAFGYDFDGDTDYDPRWGDTFYYGFPAGEENKEQIASGYTYNGENDPDGIKDKLQYGYYYPHKVFSEQSTELAALGYEGSVYDVYLKWGGARYKKYQYDPTCSGMLRSNADFAIFRYAELLLAAGEAKFRNGQDGSNEINEVRSRAKAAIASDIDMEFIRQERIRELCFEGICRTDEIRFGTFTKETVDRHYGMIPFSDAYGKFEADNDGHTILFAIPSSAMQTNTNIVQNPGY